jgi:hypothetical protein
MSGSVGPGDGESGDFALPEIWCSVCHSFRDRPNPRCFSRQFVDQFVICENYVPLEASVANTEIIEWSSI